MRPNQESFSYTLWPRECFLNIKYYYNWSQLIMVLHSTYSEISRQSFIKTPPSSKKALTGHLAQYDSQKHGQVCIDLRRPCTVLKIEQQCAPFIKISKMEIITRTVGKSCQTKNDGHFTVSGIKRFPSSTNASYVWGGTKCHELLCEATPVSGGSGVLDGGGWRNRGSRSVPLLFETS